METLCSPGSDYTACRKTFSPWSDPAFLRARSTPGAGIQACCGIHGCLDHRLGSHLQWACSVRRMDGSPNAFPSHINCLELLAVRLALSCLRGRLQGKDVLVHTENTATIAYINRQGGLHSCRMSQLARHLLLWSQKHLRSLRTSTSQECSIRRLTSCLERHFPGSGSPADLESVRSCSGRPVCISGNRTLPVVLLPIRGNARHRCTVTQLAPVPAQICIPPSEPVSKDTVQDQGGRGAGPVSGSILAQQDLVPGTHAPRDSHSLDDSSEEGSAFSETRHPLAPASRLVETPCVVPGRDARF